MKFEKFYLCDNKGNSNCVIRTFSKMYNEEYDNIYNELCDISKGLNSNSFNDVEVFEHYMKRRNTFAIKYGKNLKIKDLKLDNSKYIIFCYDKKAFYHMVPIINNTLYDKDDSSLDLYVIKVYEVKND